MLRPVGPVGHTLGGVLLVLLLATCGSDGSPEPPWGLHGVIQPADEASVARVLDALPATVAGRNRASPSGLKVMYGEHDQMGIQVMRLGEGAEAEGFPGTAGGYLELLARSGEIEIEAQQIDAEGDFVFVSGWTTTGTEAPGGTVVNERKEYLVGWGEPSSEWLFSIKADSPEHRLALVEAFIAGVRSAG